MYLYKTTAAKF